MCKSVVSERKKTTVDIIIVGKRRAFERRRELSETRETPAMISGPKTKERRKHIHRDRRRRIYTQRDARTVGPAFATINTVSPLGTALTVPRSHPVTGCTNTSVCLSLSLSLSLSLFCVRCFQKKQKKRRAKEDAITTTTTTTILLHTQTTIRKRRRRMV